jgi:hypothetical protein
MKITQDQIQLIETQGSGHTYRITGKEDSILTDGYIDLPSVTTIINNTVNKPALQPWAYNVGISSTLEYLQSLAEDQPAAISNLTSGEIKLALEEREATHKHEMERGAARGTEIHSVLEAIAKGKDYTFSREYAPYVETLKKWIDDYKPEFHKAEYKVASLEHGFAGQFDAICTINAHPPRRRHQDLTGQTVLLDIKTNKDGAVYNETYLPQVEAYHEAYTEMGGDPVDERLVVALGPAGKYTPCVSYADFNTFKCIQNLYDALIDMKSNNPNKRK